MNQVREIKFRAFGYDSFDLEMARIDTSFLTEDELNKYYPKIKPQMFYNTIIYNDCVFYGKYCETNNLNKIYFPKIMQYTELKDINGKEIYEKDILAIKNCKDDISFAEVVFSYSAFCLKSKDSYYNDELLFSIDDEFEVIGNVFENKIL